MYRDGHGPNNNQGGGRSLLDRMSGRPQRQHGGRAHDEIQARIDSITNGGMGPGSMGMPPQVMQGGMPPGMDMSAANPMMLQEMMRNQMALMAQMASSMGILTPGMMPPGQGQFPFQGQEMMQNGIGGHLGGPPGAGRGRGGIQGRGRGGHVNGAPRQDGVQSPAQNIVAPTPVVPPAQAAAAATRPGFIPPERPQTPTLCIFGVKCTNATCRFSHPSPVATAQSGVVLSSEPCENGIKCADADCVKGHVSPAVKNGAPGACFIFSSCSHPNIRTTAVPPTPSKASPAPSTNTPDRFATPCRFGSGCTRASCPFQHPEGRVLPTTFYRGLSGDQVVNVKAPETGSIGQPSHNRSMTFNAGAGAKPAATESAYERQMREIEERKRQIAELEKKAAAKKANGSSTNGSGTPDGKPVEATA
jgi:nuclear polyadenylated RNA-binding protein NAB2